MKNKYINKINWRVAIYSYLILVVYYSIKLGINGEFSRTKYVLSDIITFPIGMIFSPFTNVIINLAFHGIISSLFFLMLIIFQFSIFYIIVLFIYKIKNKKQNG